MGVYVGDKRYAPYVGSTRRKVMTEKALPYDAEIEYLESTGTQWIETGVNTVVGNLTFEVKYQFPNVTSGYKGLGYTTGSQAQAFYGLNANAATGLYACFGNNTSSLQKQMSSDKTAIHVFKVEIINSVIYYYLDGSLISSSFTTDAFTLPKFTLFGFTNNSGTLISGTTGGKMYYARLMNNGTTLFDVIPVRIGQTGYLYDRANARFFSNNGTGDFVLGPDREVIMTSETNPEVLAVCYAQGWCASPDYMTKAEAEAVTSLPNELFRNNQDIRGFNEFVYFTNPLLTSVSLFCFLASSLQSIVLPSQITTIYVDSFRQTAIEEAILNEGLVTMSRSFYNIPKLDNLCIPSTVTNVGSGLLYRATACRALIMKPLSPPTATRQDMFSYCSAKIYVPDSSVNDYKAADVWSVFESRIYGFSQLLIDYPDLYDKYIA